MFLCLLLLLLLSPLCLVATHHLQGKHDKQADVMQHVTISFVTELGHFTQPDMPDVIRLNVTTPGGSDVTRCVTLFKRPASFQRVPVYVFDSHSHHMHLDDDPEPLIHGQDLTWYTTGHSTDPQLAACIVREGLGHADLSVRLKDGSLLVLNDTAYSLKRAPLDKRSPPGFGPLTGKYLTTRRPMYLSPLPHSQNFHDKKDTGNSGCTDVYVDVCVHADYDLYERKGESVTKVLTHIKDVMNEVQTFYERIPAGRDFNFKVHIDVAKIFVETGFFQDPIKLRESLMTQTIIGGVVYEDIVHAHSLLTSWLKDHGPDHCDHYALLTGTHSGDFQPEGDIMAVFKSDAMGLSWQWGLCSHQSGQYGSLVHDISENTAVLLTHEIGHSLGLGHLTQHCSDSEGQAIMAARLKVEELDSIHWADCSILSLSEALHFWLRNKPECVIVSQAALEDSCRFQYGPNASHTWCCVPQGGSQPKLQSLCEALQCEAAWFPGTVNSTSTPHRVPCALGMQCDGLGACVPRRDQCDAHLSW
ncbi:uncharacterized protein LOC143301240 isoform X2 [Babylonia areolata]|uniref:uncharacterized protein LOC143301240 isoform X2 n=1 Tax=Babylonia areolata TaxID=304850 RepID=UPI003FD46E7A